VFRISRDIAAGLRLLNPVCLRIPHIRLRYDLLTIHHLLCRTAPYRINPQTLQLPETIPIVSVVLMSSPLLFATHPSQVAVDFLKFLPCGVWA
jgi:hypothetical protein